MERIGFGPRLGAVLIDLILSIIVVWVVGMLGGAAGGAAGGATGAAIGGTDADVLAGGFVGALMGFVAGAVLGIIIYSLIEAFTGASPGKMMLGYKIGNEDGTKGNMALYLKRWAIKNSSNLLQWIGGLAGVGILISISPIVGLIIFVGFFFALGASHQALHDKLAKTAVYRRADLAGATPGNDTLDAQQTVSTPPPPPAADPEPAPAPEPAAPSEPSDSGDAGGNEGGDDQPSQN